MLTRLIQGEQDGERLTDMELLHNCIFLLNAGHETTTNLIGNGLELLMRFPDEQRKLREDRSLVSGAVEEMLRYDTPVTMTGRIVMTEDEQVAGCPVRKGHSISPMLAVSLGLAIRKVGG